MSEGIPIKDIKKLQEAIQAMANRPGFDDSGLRAMLK
jgi:hypothetical protein